MFKLDIMIPAPSPKKYEKPKSVQQLKREIKYIKSEIRTTESKLKETEKELQLQKEETEKLAQEARIIKQETSDTRSNIEMKRKNIEKECKVLAQKHLNEKECLSNSLYDIKSERIRLLKMINNEAQNIYKEETKIQQDIKRMNDIEKKEKEELKLKLVELDDLRNEEMRLIQAICGIRPENDII